MFKITYTGLVTNIINIINFHPPEVVDRVSETQRQVVENLYLIS